MQQNYKCRVGFLRWWKVRQSQWSCWKCNMLKEFWEQKESFPI